MNSKNSHCEYICATCFENVRGELTWKSTWKLSKQSVSTAILCLVVCLWCHTNKAGMCGRSVHNASWANRFLLFIGKEWTNMATPGEARIQNRRILSFASALKEQPYETCIGKYGNIFCVFKLAFNFACLIRFSLIFFFSLDCPSSLEIKKRKKFQDFLLVLPCLYSTATDWGWPEAAVSECPWHDRSCEAVLQGAAWASLHQCLPWQLCAMLQPCLTQSGEHTPLFN